MASQDRYKWFWLKKRLEGLKVDSPVLQVADHTQAEWCKTVPDCIVIKVYGKYTLAHITQSQIVVTYSKRTKMVHRRLNEVLYGTGWAVVARGEQWALVRRGRDQTEGHPFPLDYNVALDRQGHIVYQDPSNGLGGPSNGTDNSCPHINP